MIIFHTYTQRDSEGEALGPTRDGLLEELDHLHYLCDSMGSGSPPKRLKGNEDPVVKTGLKESRSPVQVGGAVAVSAPTPDSPIRRAGPPLDATWRIRAPIPVLQSNYERVGDTLVLRRVD